MRRVRAEFISRTGKVGGAPPPLGGKDDALWQRAAPCPLRLVE